MLIYKYILLVYVTIHDEKKAILKDGDDNCLIILNS